MSEKMICLNESAASRFWPKVSKGDENDCWEWIGGTRGSGYGTFWSGVHNIGAVGAHRAAYVLAHGPILRSKYVCHMCDNRICVNPAHLYLGDAKTNTRDAIKRGRIKHAVGTKNGRSRFTPDDIRRIRHLVSQGKSFREVARAFATDHKWVAKIARREAWKHVK